MSGPMTSAVPTTHRRGRGPGSPSSPHGAARWRLTPRAALALVGAEVRKGLAVQWAHPAGHIIAMLVGAGAYLALQYVMGQGMLQRDLLPRTLVAISLLWFLYYASSVMVTDLIEEKNTGTFAQAYMTPAPPVLIMLGRLATASVGGVLMTAVAAGGPMLVARIAVPMRWQGLIPYLLVLVNVLAFTFLIAAIALATPLIAQLHNLIIGSVFLLNGSLLPVSFYPHWLAVLARILPTTLGIEATTKVLFNGDSLGDVWRDGSLPLLLAYTLGLILAGWAIYVHNHRTILRDGRLDRY